jgi:hypothetical protein
MVSITTDVGGSDRAGWRKIALGSRQEDAVAAVAGAVPPTYSIKLLSHRLTLQQKSVDLQPGEVRTIRL